MNCVFLLENKTLKNAGNWKKNSGKVREFCQSGTVRTMVNVLFF